MPPQQAGLTQEQKWDAAREGFINLKESRRSKKEDPKASAHRDAFVASLPKEDWGDYKAKEAKAEPPPSPGPKGTVAQELPAEKPGSKAATTNRWQRAKTKSTSAAQKGKPSASAAPGPAQEAPPKRAGKRSRRSVARAKVELAYRKRYLPHPDCSETPDLLSQEGRSTPISHEVLLDKCKFLRSIPVSKSNIIWNQMQWIGGFMLLLHFV